MDSPLVAHYRYRLRVSPRQAQQLQAVFDANRVVWNTALGRWNDLWRYERTNYYYSDAAAELTDWRSRFDWLAAQPCIPQQQVLRDLQKSVNGYFGTRHHGRRPRYKKKGRCVSARWTRSGHGFGLQAGRLSVAVSGGRTLLRVVWSRPLPSDPTSVTIHRDPGGRWWATFVVRVGIDGPGLIGEVTGLDLGLTTFATTESSDTDVLNPRFSRCAAKALARSQRNTARKTPGSAGREKARRRTARVHARIANQRRDFIHKEARKLAWSYDRIGVEAITITNMVAKGRGRHKSGLSRSIHDAGWGQFLAALEWQAKKCGHEVVRMPALNTTQNCSACGTKAKVHVGLKQRTFECSECGLVLDRDRNAARNLNPGWAVPGAPVDGSKTLIPAGSGQPEGRNRWPPANEQSTSLTG